MKKIYVVEGFRANVLKGKKSTIDSLLKAQNQEMAPYNKL